MMPRQSFVIAMLFAALTFSGCAATVTALKYKDLEIQTKMSETIFLEPVPIEKRTVWVDVKDTSDQDIDLTPVAGLLAAKGYRVVANPDSAHYLLQVNVLYVGKASQAAIDQSVQVGFGGPLIGMAAGAGIGAIASNNPFGSLVGAGVGGLVGGMAEVIADSLVKAVTYCVITDLQLSERSATPVSQVQRSHLKQGTQTRVQQEARETTDWKRYRNRVASTATQVNLDFNNAKPALVERLMKSLAGLL